MRHNPFFEVQTAQHLDHSVIAPPQCHSTPLGQPVDGHKDRPAIARPERSAERDLKGVIGTPFDNPQKDRKSVAQIGPLVRRRCQIEIGVDPLFFDPQCRNLSTRLWVNAVQPGFKNVRSAPPLYIGQRAAAEPHRVV